MQDQQNQSNEKTYEGTPEDVGAALVFDALSPTVNDAIANQPPAQVARMLSGMLAGLTAMVAITFGPDAAAEMLEGTTTNLRNNQAAPSVN